MIRIRVTEKAIKDAYTEVYGMGGSHELSPLLKFEEPRAYTAGKYGEKAELFDINNIALVVGYQPIGKPLDCEMLRKYEDEAERIIRSPHWPEYDTRAEVKRLLGEFIQEQIVADKKKKGAKQ